MPGAGMPSHGDRPPNLSNLPEGVTAVDAETGNDPRHRGAQTDPTNLDTTMILGSDRSVVPLERLPAYDWLETACDLDEDHHPGSPGTSQPRLTAAATRGRP
jgi:hypothetical protein